MRLALQPLALVWVRVLIRWALLCANRYTADFNNTNIQGYLLTKGTQLGSRMESETTEVTSPATTVDLKFVRSTLEMRTEITQKVSFTERHSRSPYSHTSRPAVV